MCPCWDVQAQDNASLMTIRRKREGKSSQLRNTIVNLCN
jgi:hypothetical protein